MTLFKASRLSISTPLDDSDDGYGYEPNEDDEARDNRIDRINDLAAELSHSAQFCFYSTLQRITGEFIDGKITNKEMIEQSKGKKVVIRK